MKRRIVCVLAMALVVSAAFGNKRQKIDPGLKSIHTIFVQGKEDSGVKEARESLEFGKCFQLAPDAESADAVMTILWSTESQAFPGSGDLVSVPWKYKVKRTTVILRTHEGGKLKKGWSNSIDLRDFEEARKSGVRRLIDNLRQEVCAQP